MGKRRRRRRKPAQPDWSREPRGEAEAALRAAFLAGRLERGSPGWIELLCLAMNRDQVPADLRRAAAEAERRLAARVEARRRHLLRLAADELADGPASE